MAEAPDRIWIDRTSLQRGHGYIYPMNPDNADWDSAPIPYIREAVTPSTADDEQVAQQVIADWHDYEKWRDPSMMPIPPFSGAQEQELARLICESLAQSRADAIAKIEAKRDEWEREAAACEPTYDLERDKCESKIAAANEILALLKGEK